MGRAKRNVNKFSLEAFVESLREELVEKASPGERLPSTREISRRFKVSYARAFKAAKELARLGHVVAKPRSGLFVPFVPKPRKRTSVGLAYWDYSDVGVPRLSLSFIFYGLRKILSNYFYDVHLFPYQVHKFMDQHYHELASGNLDHLLVEGTLDEAEQKAIEEHGTQVIYFRFGVKPRGSCVCLDMDHGYALIFGHLLNLGHSKITFVSQTYFLEDTWDPAGDAIEKARRNPKLKGLEIEKIHCRSILQRGNFEELLPLFEPPMPKAVVFHDEESLQFFLLECTRRGLRIPGDFSVAVFFNALRNYHRGFLTSIDLVRAVTEMAELAAEMVLRGKNREPQVAIVKPHLIAGESTRPLK